MVVEVWDVGKSKGYSVMEYIWVLNVTQQESEPTSNRCFFAREYGELKE
jgi:hypothetical protein